MSKELFNKLLSPDQCFKKLLTFLIKNKQHFNYEQVVHLTSSFARFIQEGYQTDLSLQVYDHLGFINPNNNPYIQFLDILKKKHRLDQDIVEIGGGELPAFSKYIAREQLKLGKGTITVYDPYLEFNKRELHYSYPNLRLVKKEIDLDSDLKPCDLIVSRFACDAAELIVEQADENDYDYFISLCACDHMPYPFLENLEYLEDARNYREFIINKSRALAERKNCDHHLLPYDMYNDVSPIISVQKRLKK